MRRRYPASVVSLVYLLQQANALSLANFQGVSLGSVPLRCLVEYDSSIDVCTLSDFKNGCSAACQAALTSKAACVSEACSGATVTATSLLGIIENGGIIGALCPSFFTTTVTSIKTTTTPTKTSTTKISLSVASTTRSAQTSQSSSAVVQSTTSESTSSTSSEVVGSTTSATSQTSSSSTLVVSTTSQSTSSVQQTTPATSSPTQSTTTSTKSSNSKSTTTKSSTSKSATATSTNNNGNGDGKTGGGSPFDIDANGAAIRIHGLGSTFVLVIAFWVGALGLS
ncbi:hypothetical protein CJF30_00005991 [Rutstroemia sp. NJR-2017a BBW]|nr:hypothetical protein CJF30_00005991 [Rutstroemia sp. NJR-2017a BBW]